MKKIGIIIFSFFVLINSCNAISASNYVVMDIDNNNVLMGSNINDKHLIASISKIMTGIIIVENSDINKKIVVDNSILSAVGSSIYIEIGEKISIKDLLYGMMMRSGNDAATMLAVSLSGSMEKFSALMNKYAQNIGMKNSYFINSTGLENENGEGNISTAYDMALLTSYAIKNPIFKEIFGTKNYIAKSDKKTYSWTSKNKLLKYDYVTGGKTGYTIKAKRTLVTTGHLEDMNICIVTLKDSNDFNDHRNIYEYIKENYSKKLILDKDNFKIVDDTLYLEDKLYIKNSYSLIMKNGSNNISVKYYLYKKNKYHNNEKVGNAVVYKNNKEIYSEEIFIKKNNKNKNMSWFQRIFNK